MAVGQRKPKAGLIVHSDRGSQYASKKYRHLLSDKGYIGSMSSKGDCWDNAVAESFFSQLKEDKRPVAKLSKSQERKTGYFKLQYKIL